MKILKIDAKIDFSAEKNSKKFVYYNENMYTNSKFQTQFSRKLQRFRGCRKNKKCPIFHGFSEYQQKMATFFSHWTGPLIHRKNMVSSSPPPSPSCISPP